MLIYQTIILDRGYFAIRHMEELAAWKIQAPHQSLHRISVKIHFSNAYLMNAKWDVIEIHKCTDTYLHISPPKRIVITLSRAYLIILVGYFEVTLMKTKWQNAKGCLNKLGARSNKSWIALDVHFRITESLN